MYQKYSIGTMAHLMGISAEALRYYESKNIVSPIRDPETGYRYFNTWDFHMLLRARHYQNYGFSLEEIGELFRSGELSQVREKMEDQEAVIEKEIIRLEPNEVAILLDQVEDGTKLTKKELEYHKKTKLRDVALLTLLLGTGIRVSECVGLDINDVDFNNGGIKIRRKGGYEAIVYFGDEVETALLDYLEQREHIIPAEGHENALFLSLQSRRMAVRSVENLVKKYASRVTTLKKITPHKLRSTYGTELYKETRDIYLVADVLGHKDVNTTRKHYAALEEQRRRQAANAFHLREHSNRHSDQPDK